MVVWSKKVNLVLVTLTWMEMEVCGLSFFPFSHRLYCLNICNYFSAHKFQFLTKFYIAYCYIIVHLMPHFHQELFPQITVCLIVCCCCPAAQLCPTLCGPRDCSPPGSSVHGISQVRVLEWVSIPFSICIIFWWPQIYQNCPLLFELFKKVFLTPKVIRIYKIFSKSCEVFLFTFKPLIHLYLVFVSGVKYGILFYFMPCSL